MVERQFPTALAVIAGLAVVLPGSLRAQGNGPGTWQFEVGGGIAVPTGSDLSDFVKTGADFDVLIGYQVHERIGLNAYGGLSLLKGKDDTAGLTTSSTLPDQDIWRFGMGAEANLTQPGNALIALLGVGVGAANVRISAFSLDTSPTPTPVDSNSKTSFSSLVALKFLYKVNPNFALGAGAEWVLVFGADALSDATQTKTLSYLPVKVFLRWLQ